MENIKELLASLKEVLLMNNEVLDEAKQKILFLVSENKRLKKELEEEKNLNSEIKARFVKCSSCTSDMKANCLMFSENLCEGERCTELIDLASLVNKGELNVH